MTALNDEETQRKGIIIISYSVGAEKATDKDSAWCIAHLCRILPIPTSVFHGCSDNPEHRVALSVAQLSLGTQLRIRCRLHFGTSIFHVGRKRKQQGLRFLGEPFLLGIFIVWVECVCVSLSLSLATNIPILAIILFISHPPVLVVLFPLLSSTLH